MKKVITILLLIALLITSIFLVSCDEENKNWEYINEQEATEKLEDSFLFSLRNVDDAFYHLMGLWQTKTDNGKYYRFVALETPITVNPTSKKVLVTVKVKPYGRGKLISIDDFEDRVEPQPEKEYYVANFYDLNNNLIASIRYAKGETPSFFGDVPVIFNEGTIYNFLKWDHLFEPITANTDFHAVYSKMPLGGGETSAPVEFKNAICFTNTGSNPGKVTIVKNGSGADMELECSSDHTSWSDFTLGSLGGETINPGKKLYIRAKTLFTDYDSSKYFSIRLDNATTYSVSGDIRYFHDPNGSRTFANAYEYYNLFNGATALVDASKLELPFTTVYNFSFAYMFKGCSSLTKTPEIPNATTNSSTYESMFEGCSSLTAAPALPADSAYYSCYKAMFKDCVNLETAPALPATTLYTYCYDSMFEGCSSLTAAPTLSNESLDDGCYKAMFKDCVNLETAPALPATNLKPYCYQEMFKGCTSLTTAPDLDATDLKECCYKEIFNGCSKLNSIKVAFNSFTSFTNNETTDWVKSVASTGSFVWKGNYRTKNNVGNSKIPTGWVIDSDIPNYFFIENINGTSSGNAITLKLYKATASADIILEYSTDLINWTPVTVGSSVANINIAKGSTVYIRNQSTAPLFSKYVSAGDTYDSFHIDMGSLDQAEIGGDVTTLITTEGLGNTALTSNTLLSGLFKGCQATLNIDDLKLPSKLTDRCFAGMFDGCTGITSIPASLLPATTLKASCYKEMFKGSGVTSVPKGLLPATTVAYGCYASMFAGSSVASLPENLLPATSTGVEDAYREMFRGCTSLTSVPDNLISSTVFGKNTCREMFAESGVKTIPEGFFNVAKMGESSYYGMFQNCKSLTTVNGAIDISAGVGSNACWHMFEGCSALTKAPELPSTKLGPYCYNSMFKDCSVLEEGPTLPATSITPASASELTSCCYASMFSGCSKLSKLIVCFDTFPDSSYYTENWLQNAGTSAATHEFIWRGTNSSINKANGNNTVPSGWTITHNDAPQYINNPLFTIKHNAASGEAAKIKLVKNGSPDAISLQYSVGGSAFTDYTIGTDIDLPLGESLQLKATTSNSTFSKSATDYYQFVFTSSTNAAKLDVENDITSLLDADHKITSLAGKPYCFTQLFKDCTLLYTEGYNGILKPTTLSDYCYFGIFSGCTLLQNIVAVPAKNLGEGCYKQMYMGCTSLAGSTVYSLNATELKPHCYEEMFKNCSNFGKLYVAFDTFDGMPTDATKDWLDGVKQPGTFNWKGDGDSIPEATLPRGPSTVPAYNGGSGWMICHY